MLSYCFGWLLTAWFLGRIGAGCGGLLLCWFSVFGFGVGFVDLFVVFCVGFWGWFLVFGLGLLLRWLVGLRVLASG